MAAYKKKGSGRIIGGLDSSRKYPFELQLYVIPDCIHCVRATQNIERICREYLNHQFVLEIVDLSIHPELIQQEAITVTPTLVRSSAQDERRLINDLSNEKNILWFLGLPVK